jgi:hypothetical protein
MSLAATPNRQSAAPVVFCDSMTDKTFVLFQQEGYLFHSCLTTGVTALRTANVLAKGQLYVAFFQLSIGLERLMKVILIIDRIAATGKPPIEKELKDQYGHDLVTLFRSVERVLGAVKTPPPDLAPLTFGILKFLSEFAKTTRYFNLGVLTRGGSAIDPLEHWDNLLSSILRADANPKRVAWIEASSSDLASNISDRVFVHGYDLRKNKMDVGAWLAMPQVQDLAAAYAVRRVFDLLTLLRDALSSACGPLHARGDERIPFMGEFLQFVHPGREQPLKKRRWP